MEIKYQHKIIGIFLLILISFFFIKEAYTTHANHAQSISTSALEFYDQYPPAIENLIVEALKLAKQNLTYQYGSADPKNKGMDCSGTVYYLLRKKFHVSEVPRQSDQIYTWVLQKGDFHAVNSNDFNSQEFSELKPGDLLFWTGTYKIKRHIPVTHVMIYLGKNKSQEPLMFGASNGRSYQKEKIWGVSVFNFQLPASNSPSRFVGYSCIPTLTCALNTNKKSKAM